MAKKLDPEIQEHIHRELPVTPERVKAFGRAKYGIRLQVLAELRSRADSRLTGSDLAIVAITLSLFIFLVSPTRGIDFGAMNWVVLIVVSLTLACVLLLALLLLVIPHWRDLWQQRRASVWLAAYEDEIARRVARKGTRRG